MAISLTHAFTSAKADGADATLVQPSNWNAQHTLTVATATLVGRTTAGTGAAEEISVGSGLLLSGGSLSNSAPDQTVTLTQGGTTTITGTYPNFTISSADQYVGTVTSVGGTGTVNGITLSGTVTSSGSLTLGGTLSGVDLTTQVTGTLPVANGGTGTTTAFTAGSVVFAGASGTYSQDNTNLFWDDTNNRLGIGTATPATAADIVGTATVTSLKEGVYSITGTTPALDPANGGMQNWTLTGNSTPTDSFSAGQSMLLMINDGTAYTITWPTMTWIGGSAPTLDTSGLTTVELWKRGGVLYGALVGVA